MNDGEALLKAILASPKDDTPRLVFADWLEENGEPERAEFIRVQVELAQWPLPHRCNDPECCYYANDCVRGCAIRVYEALRRRERELLTVDNARVWSAPVREYWGQFNRGFIFALELSWSDWLAHADAILREQPVERVKLTTPTDIDYFDSDMEMLWSPNWHSCDSLPVKVLDRDELMRVAKLDDSDERAFLRYFWPTVEFDLVHPPEMEEGFGAAADLEAETPITAGGQNDPPPNAHPMIPFTHPYRR